VTAGRHLCVLGTSGAGKSRLAAAVSERLGVPWIELDALVHRAGWQQAPVDELLAQSADTYVWLDYPRRLVMWRPLRRTLGRLVGRRELWNGNREHWSNLFRRDPHLNILLWAWTTHASTRATLLADAADSGASWVRLRHPPEAARWLATL
jgi:adenylate kinase family enzyme